MVVNAVEALVGATFRAVDKVARLGVGAGRLQTVGVDRVELVQKGWHRMEGLVLEPNDYFTLVRVHVVFDDAVAVSYSAKS